MTPFGCVGSNIRLHSGGYIDLLNPDPAAIHLSDIAHALSQMCRFGGHTARFYSVAEHCWHAADQALADGHGLEVQRACLLHDATEAYLGDVVKPLKQFLPEYTQIERAFEAVIRRRFGLTSDPSVWAVVKEIDQALLIAERRAWFTADTVTWTGEDTTRSLPRVYWGHEPTAARVIYLKRAEALGVS
jgi:5'-deoxynucleotidase YfbR-like HD superfamily hydrolase